MRGAAAVWTWFRLVVMMPDGGWLRLCRFHAASAVKGKVAVLASQTRGARVRARAELRAELARRQAAKEKFAMLASRTRAKLARRKAADSPAQTPSKPRVDDEARRPVAHHRLERRAALGMWLWLCFLLFALFGLL